MQIYIVSISILLLNPNRSHNSILPTSLGRCQLRAIRFVVISNLGDFILNVRLHRSLANATEIEIEKNDVHNVNTQHSSPLPPLTRVWPLRFVMKCYVYDAIWWSHEWVAHWRLIDGVGNVDGDGRQETETETEAEAEAAIVDRHSGREYATAVCARNPLGLLHEQHTSMRRRCESIRCNNVMNHASI